MCLIALSFAARPDQPLLLAANREEAFHRPALAPHFQPGAPRVICGIDQTAGGTWLGVNQHGLLVAVTNRPKRLVPLAPRSRGLVCRELLSAQSAAEAHRRGIEILERDACAGCNFLCVDASQGWVIHAGDVLESIALSPGLHLLSNGDLNDPHDDQLNRVRDAWREELASEATEFVAWGEQVCSLGPGPAGEPPIVLRKEGRGTVSSSIVAVTPTASDALYRHASGPPDLTPYLDFSPVLREVLAADAA